MTRGNQRELAREKNAKKQAAVKAKGAGDQSGSKGASLEQRKHRDAEIMREKQKKAADAKK
ncbi:Putative SERF-like protein [Geodia barretti]|uniref:SERF-like protein n=1 Tax=Geodia barretti TaxID=519541 RepID=A0AA35WXV6_GEOBA|nr:Putative SERF-like protein [Geodia barretti]